MTDITAPWSLAVLDIPVAAYSTTFAVSVTVPGAQDYALVPIAGTVSFDARRSPRIVADLEVAWPSDEVRALLDPRLALTVTIDAGYRFFASDQDDTQTVATLRVQSVESDYVARTIRINAQSDEVVAIGYPLDYALAYAATDTVVAAIQGIIASAFPGETPSWVIGDNVPIAAVFGVAPTTVTVGQDRWTLVQDWSDSIGVDVWHDGLGYWHIDPADPVPGSAAQAHLTTGPRGTIVNVVTTEALAGYANQVAVVYTYSASGVNKISTYIAKTGLQPVQMVLIANAFAPHNGAEVARNALQRGLRRGHTVAVEAASHLWVRPGLAVTVDLPDGLQERLLVETVTFDLAAGSMQLTGQSPDAASLQALTTIVTSATTVAP